MRNTISKLALTATLVLAITLTFSCGEHDAVIDEPSSSSAEIPSSSDIAPSSSSDDGGTDEPSSSSAESPSSSGIAPSSSSTVPSSSSGTPSSSSIAPSSSSSTASSSSSLPSSSGQTIVYGEPITDARDGKTYETVVIGKQTWMAKNLDFEAATGSRCYSDDPQNCALYGRLYTWDAAMDACPAGWHLPNDIEWVLLEDFIGGTVSAAWTKLRATSSNNGTDNYGFSALSVPNSSYYWSSEENGTSSVYNHSFSGSRSSVSKSNSYHVRCIKGDTYTPSSSSYTPVSCANAEGKDFCDDRDGKSYKSVVIGNQTWMAENLNFEAEGSKCYGNNPANCDKYGRLYNWGTAIAESSCNRAICSSWITENHKGICPTGWHVPSDAEFQALVTFAGGNNTAGNALKATSGWNDRSNGSSGNGTDQHGFSALPGGGGYSSGSFFNVGNNGFWWSATENSASLAYDRVMDVSGANVVRVSNIKSGLYSVRCLQD